VRASGNADGSRPQTWSFALEGTWGADFIAELKPKSSDIVISKLRSSAFYNTDLDLILRSKGVELWSSAVARQKGALNRPYGTLGSTTTFRWL